MSDREVLYAEGINPIEGLDEAPIWGQRTLERRQEEIARVNNRTVVNIIQRFVSQRLNDYMFELNDEITRRTLTSEIEEYMIHLRDSERALYDFRVVCDETNNTPEHVDGGMVNVDVMVQPSRAVEYITFRASLNPQPVSFGEGTIEFKSDADAYRHRLGFD